MFCFKNQIAILYVVIIALFFNTATAMAVSGVNDGEVNGNKVLLCTLQGYQWVSLDGVDDSAPPLAKHCQFCLFPSIDDSVSDFFAYISSNLVYFNSLEVNKLPSIEVLASESFYSIAQGRAPPVLT